MYVLSQFDKCEQFVVINKNLVVINKSQMIFLTFQLSLKKCREQLQLPFPEWQNVEREYRTQDDR